jgi:signal transduction histidine kinase
MRIRSRMPPPWAARQPWPMHRGGRPWSGSRARFFRRMAFLALLLLLSGVLGAITLVSALAARFGIVAASPAGTAIVAGGAMLGALCTAALILVGGMRLFGGPLAAVMDAAARVAGGDYAVRVAESGAPPFRMLARAFNTMTARLADNDRLRRDLMADVAHELRTPLTVVQGKLEGLIDGVYPRDDRQLEEVLEETRVLARLVEDLRTLAMSEAGALTLQLEPTDVGALAADAARTLAADAAARGVTIAADAASDLPTLEIDPVRIREVLVNLLNNAVRHTPSGGAVTATVRALPRAIQIEVRDTGEGMSADQLAHAFDRFYKSPGSRGSGLGLTIARHLVEQHHGQIRLASEPGGGTTVTVTLPTASPI